MKRGRNGAITELKIDDNDKDVIKILITTIGKVISDIFIEKK